MSELTIAEILKNLQYIPDKSKFKSGGDKHFGKPDYYGGSLTHRDVWRFINQYERKTMETGAMDAGDYINLSCAWVWLDKANIESKDWRQKAKTALGRADVLLDTAKELAEGDDATKIQSNKDQIKAAQAVIAAHEKPLPDLDIPLWLKSLSKDIQKIAIPVMYQYNQSQVRQWVEMAEGDPEYGDFSETYRNFLTETEMKNGTKMNPSGYM